MGDDKSGSPHSEMCEGLLHQLLRLGIETRGGFVEKEHGRLAKQSPRDGNALQGDCEGQGWGEGDG